MTKAKLVEELKLSRTAIDTTSELLSDRPTQSSNERQRLLHEIQALQAKLEEQDIEMQNMRQELDETRKHYATT